MAGEQRHSERHLPKAQTHLNTHPQEHRSHWPPARSRSLHGATVGGDAFSSPSRRSEEHAAFTLEFGSLVRRVLRMPWGELWGGHQGDSQQDHQLSGCSFSWAIPTEPKQLTAANIEETYCSEDKKHEDKRMHDLVCILSSPQEKSQWCPSQLLGTAPGPYSPREMCGVNWYGCRGYWCHNWGRSPHPGIPFYPVLSHTGKALMDLQTFPGGTQGNHVLCQLSFPFSRPCQPHLSAGKLGHSSKHAAQRSPEIFGHAARELAALSEL